MLFFLAQRTEHIRKQADRKEMGANREIDACGNQKQEHQRDADRAVVQRNREEIAPQKRVNGFN